MREMVGVYLLLILRVVCAFGGYHEEGEDHSFDLGSRDTQMHLIGGLMTTLGTMTSKKNGSRKKMQKVVRTDTMTHDEFMKKWGSEVYNEWHEHMKKDEVKNVQ